MALVTFDNNSCSSLAVNMWCVASASNASMQYGSVSSACIYLWGVRQCKRGLLVVTSEQRGAYFLVPHTLFLLVNKLLLPLVCHSHLYLVYHQ